MELVPGSESQQSVIAASEELTVALATELARDGRLEESEELLMSLPEPASSVRHDLLARIRAQQGDLDAAEAHWRQVPGDDALAPGAAAGLHRIEVLRRRPRWLRFNLWFGAVVAGVVAIVLAGAVGIAIAVSSIASAPPNTDSTLSPSPQASASVAATPTSSPSASSSPAAELGATPEPPDLDLKLAGVSVVTTGDAWVVTFDRGLFDAGAAVLSSQGKSTLKRVAARVKASKEPVDVLVTGHTDSVPLSADSAFASNAALGYARAAAAAAYLQRTAGLPLRAVSSASAGAMDPIASNDSRSGRQRNRTVVLEIRAR